MEWKKRTGESSFKEYEKQVVLAYEKALENLKFNQFETAVDEVFDEYKDQVYTYTRDLIKELKSKKYILLAISGSQTEIIARVADYYGFDYFVGTVYEHRNGRFTGKKTIASFNKAKTLQNLVKKHNLNFKDSIAVGDSISDAPMMELVDFPYAFNPDKQLFDFAKKYGWRIVVERKNMVYELEKANGRYKLVKADSR